MSVALWRLNTSITELIVWRVWKQSCTASWRYGELPSMKPLTHSYTHRMHHLMPIQHFVTVSQWDPLNAHPNVWAGIVLHSVCSFNVKTVLWLSEKMQQLCLFWSLDILRLCFYCVFHWHVLAFSAAELRVPLTNQGTTPWCHET